MLNEPKMKNMFINKTYNYKPYHDSHLYFWGESHINRTEWSNILPGRDDTWTYYNQRTGKQAVFYTATGFGSGNAAYHEHLHPTEWDWIDDAGYNGGGRKQEEYRRMHSAGLVGFSLAALAFDATNYLANNKYIPYTDRWMSETTQMMSDYGAPVSTHPVQTSKMDFVDELWFRHRDSLNN